MNTLLDAAKRVIEAHKDGVGLQYEINMLERAVAESEGMVLVPSEPTDEIISAMASASIDRQDWGTAEDMYRAMLSATQVQP